MPSRFATEEERFHAAAKRFSLMVEEGAGDAK
jgi:hypothetical protein